MEEKQYLHLQQEDNYGCGLYALANALQDESFFTEERLEQSKNGNHVGQLNKWLLDHGKDLFLEPLYFSCCDKRLPDNICGLKPGGEGVVSMPVLIDVQFSETGKMHFVCGAITTEGKLLVLDSLKEVPFLTTLAEFNERYYRVFGLWALRGYTGENNWYMRYD